MTGRPTKTPTQTLKAAGKQRSNSDYFSSLPISQLPSELLPDLIAQRCLEALSYIVSANDSSLRSMSCRPACAVECRRRLRARRRPPRRHNPVILLLNLPDRQSLLKTPSILESLVSLLDNVTRPLKSLKDPKSVEKPEAAPASTSAAPPAQSSTSASTLNNTVPTPEPSGPPGSSHQL